MGVFEVHHAVLVMSALIKFAFVVNSILEYSSVLELYCIRLIVFT